MYTINSNEARLDDLLNRMAKILQLDEGRVKKMETAYKTVSKWIEDDKGFFKNIEFEIYPHGSVLAGTTVKPSEKEEFDLDFVIHIRMDWEKYDPAKVYNELNRRLKEHDFYKNILEPKNRVLRLNYAGDFHMDIMPGCQEFEYDPDRILVRDKRLKDNVSSNPRGYGAWFNDKAETVREFLLEEVYAMADIPDQKPYHLKKPLKRAVQIIKRYRNIYFENDPDYATSSIILTTLAGQFYSGEGTIYETVNNIVSRMYKVSKKGLEEFKVYNPVNRDEDFTEKWQYEPKLFERFIDFVKDFKQTWEAIKRGSDINESEDELITIFGQRTINKATNEQREYFAKPFKNGTSFFPALPDKNDYEGLRRLAVKSKPYYN